MDVDMDRDLQSIQQARRLASAAARAQREFADATQDEVDRICAAMAAAGEREAGRLGTMAHEETGYGHADHKRIKNEFASRTVWESIRDVQTVGVLHRDEVRGVVDIAWPVGVVVALSPSTNPTSTALFKILIAVKARNGIVVAGHPSAARSTAEAVRVMAEAGEAVGMPAGLVACLEPVDIGGTQELMRHPDTAMILATGGPGMVTAAHGMGKPAIGVGPGNVPAYVDRSADIDRAASDIVNSKAFDCSTICSSEQTVVADRPIADRLRAAMEAEGAYWLDDAQRRAIEGVLFRGSHGALNPEAVGRTPLQLATLAGIRVPESARVLVGEIDGVGPMIPLSREKLTTVLGWTVVDGWRAGCERSIELLRFGGLGHSIMLHASDDDVITAWGLEKPAFRVLLNTWSTLGAIGATTGLAPSLTLAPGGVGGAVVGDNITVHHLLNVKRMASEIRRPPAEAFGRPGRTTTAPAVPASGPVRGDDRELVDAVVRRVLAALDDGGGR